MANQIYNSFKRDIENVDNAGLISIGESTSMTVNSKGK